MKKYLLLFIALGLLSGKSIYAQCTTGNVLTTSSGAITDGSGTADYNNGASCSWLIQPAGATQITLNFTAFATEANYDFVTIYNGTSAAGIQVGNYSGATLPGAVVVPSGNVFITFTSDGSVTAAGFSLNYTSSSLPPATPCSGNLVLTATSGTITDGSGTADYSNGTNCSWLIQPAGASQITINFTEFATESGYDFVTIYNGTSATGTQVGTYSGTALPPTIVVPSGNAFITFTSDGSVTAAGFSLNYSGCGSLPASSINTPSSTAFCTQTSILLTSGNTGSGLTYSWILNGTAIPNSNAPTYAATSPGVYQLSVSNAPGCSSLSSTITLSSGGPTITVSSSASTICPGGSSQLSAQQAAFSDNCDDNITPLSLLGAVSSTTCGSYLGNAYYFNDATRSATTSALNVSTGGTVSFYLEIASGAAPCEQADAGEDVFLQYSVDNGTTWITLAIYAPGSYNNFTAVNVSIPQAAMSAATLFRWTQPSNSGLGFDNWALDEISISTSTGNLTYLWTPAAGLSATNIANPVCTASVSTTYTVAASNGTCTSYATTDITVVQATPATISVTGPTAICPGGSVQLTANTGTSYLWSNGDTAQSISVTQAGNYSVTVSYGSGCSAVSQPVAVSVSNTLNAALTNGGNNTICNGSSVNLISNLASPNTGQWFLNGVLIPNVSASNYAATAGGQYYMVQTNPQGCTDTSNVVVVNDNTPVALVTANPAAICPGGTSQLNVIAGGFSDNFDGAVQPWVINGGSTTTNGCGSVSGNALTFDGTTRDATTPALNVSSGGSISFSLEIGSGGAPCEQADAGEDVILSYSVDNGTTWTTIATYLAGAYNAFTPITETIPTAALGTATLFRWSQPSNTGPGFDNWAIDNVSIATNNASISYNWSPAAGLSATTIANPLANPTSTTTYQVTLTSNGCSAQYGTTITISGSNSASITSSGNVICPGDTAILTASAGGSYLWTSGDTTQSIAVLAAGSYGVSVTYPGGCTSTAAPVQVILNALPSAQLSGTGNNIICSGGGVALTANTNPGNILQWYLNGTALSGATSGNYQAQQAGTYSVKVINAAGCSAFSNPLVVTSNAPQVEIFADPAAVCPGETTQLFANASLLTEHFEDSLFNNISVVGGVPSTTCGGTLGNSLYFDGPTERSLTTGAVDATLVASVSVYMNIASGAAPCEQADAGEDIVLEYSIDNGTTWVNMFTYLTGSYNSFIYTTTTVPAAAQTNATQFRLRQVSFSGSGFDNWSIDDFTLDLTLTAATYSWSPAAGLSSTNIFNPVASPATSTNYTVTTSVGQCTGTSQLLVSVLSSNINPNASTVNPSCPTCCDGSISLSATGGNAPLQYVWTPAPAVGQGTANVSGLCDGTYSVLISDSLGCPLTYAVTLSSVPTGIQAQDEMKIISYPNPFSDVLTIRLSKVKPGSEIVLQDVLGKTLRSFTCNGSSTMQVSTGDLSSGVYFLELRNGSEKSVQKIHKQ